MYQVYLDEEEALSTGLEYFGMNGLRLLIDKTGGDKTSNISSPSKVLKGCYDAVY